MEKLRVLESDLIESIKLQIQSFKGFVVKNQKLVCGGREICKSISLIRDYGVADVNALLLVLKIFES
ncbi:Phosphatidylinositol 4-kinase gamma 4 [Linum perenne]